MSEMGEYHEQPTDRIPRYRNNNDRSTPPPFKNDKPEMSESEKAELEQKIASLLNAGLKAFEGRDYGEAIKRFEDILKLQPDNLIAYEKLSIARSIQADLDSTEEYMSIGRECLKNNDWRGAADEFQAVLSIIPTHPEAQRLLKQIQRHLGGESAAGPDSGHSLSSDESEPTLQIPEFEGEFEIDRSNEPDSAKYLIEEATAALELKEETKLGASDQPDGEFRDFKKGIEKAIGFYELGQLESAYQLLKKLDAFFPGQSQVSYYIEIIQRKLDSDKSSHDQGNAERFFKEGMDELEKNNPAGALRKFEDAIDLKPDFQQAHLMIEKIKSTKTPKPKTKPETEKKKAPPRPIKIAPSHSLPGTSRPILKYVMIGGALLFLAALVYFFSVKYPDIQVANHLKLARQKYNEKEYLDALKELTEVKKIDNKIPFAWELEGEIDLILERGQDAIRAFARLCELEPGKTRNIELLGQAYFQNGENAKAEAQFRQVILDPAFETDGYFNLGMALSKESKTEEAAEAFRKVIEKNPDLAKAHLELARILESKETPELAESEYMLAIEKDSKFTDAYIALGRYYISLQKPEQAIEILSQPLLWLKASNTAHAKIVADIRMLLGKTYYDAADFDKAADQFNAVLMLKEHEEAAYIEVGRTYYKLGKDMNAIKAWTQALEINPKNADVHFFLGSTYHRIGNTAKEIEEYQTAISLDPKHARSYANLGFVYFNQYKFPQAKEAWVTSLAIDPNQPLIARKLKEIETQSQK
jgi:tetratricopeptide (TPR) repeat protein